MNQPEVQCEATGLPTVFSYEACSTGTHTFTINWLDEDVIFSQELEAGQVFEQTYIYDVDLPGNHNLAYELKLEGSNTTLTSSQAWSWEIDESGCTPLYQTRGNCLAEPTFVCDGLGQVSSFSYQACSSGEHEFEYQWDADEENSVEQRTLSSGEVFTAEHTYTSKGLKLPIFRVLVSSGPGSLGRFYDENEWLVDEDTCNQDYQPTMAPSPPPPSSGGSRQIMLQSGYRYLFILILFLRMLL